MPLPQTIQVPVEITNLKIAPSDEDDSGLYLCKIRYFAPDDSMAAVVEGGDWELQDKEWRLDANATGLILAVGDKISAYWHQQRGMFVPCNAPMITIRPFRLTADLIPTGGAELDMAIQGEWLDDPGYYVILHPEHRAGLPSGDAFLSLGIGRGSGNYFRGTYGWAKWVHHGTAYLDGDGGIAYQGEWQIVNLFPELIVQVRVYDADIDPGDEGLVQLWWIDKNEEDPDTINSTYQINIYNDLEVPLTVGMRLKAYFNRNHYVWQPIAAPTSRNFAVVQTAWSNTKAGPGVGSRVSETVAVKTCDYDDATTDVGDEFDVHTMPHPYKDTALFDSATAKLGAAGASIIEWGLAPNGDKVIVSDIWDDPFGTVKWESVNTANIRDGWHLCDGTNGTPDLSGMFLMCIDDTGLGEADEDDIGDTGGFRRHGTLAGVPQNDHDNHAKADIAAAIEAHAAASFQHVPHVIDDHIDVVQIYDAAGSMVLGSPQAHNISTNHEAGVDDHGPIDHVGSVLGDDLVHSQTDNRPRFYVMAAIQRFE